MSKGRLTIKYIDEINAFHHWVQVNELPASAILLWYSLMHFCNKTGWKKKFNVALSQLEADTHLGTTTIQRARDRLVKAGLLKIIHRSGRQSAVYQIIPVSAAIALQFEQLNEQQSGFAVQNEQLNEQLSEHIPRHRHRLINKTEDAGSTTGKKMVVSYYQNKIHPLHNTTELELLEALVDDHGRERVEQAIDRAVLRGKQSIRYINGILKRWETDGYDEAETVVDDELQIPAEFRNVTF